MEDWYIYMGLIRGEMREVAARMTAARAEALGAVHAPGFSEEAARRAGMVISKLAPEGRLEAAILAEQGLTAEIPNR